MDRNYDLAVKRMYATEKTFERKQCLEEREAEVQKLEKQDFITKVDEREILNLNGSYRYTLCLRPNEVQKYV